MTLNELLIHLAERGCYPGIRRHGKKWRAHINICGNFWDEGATPKIALENAMQAWQNKGCIMDGYAVIP